MYKNIWNCMRLNICLKTEKKSLCNVDTHDAYCIACNHNIDNIPIFIIDNITTLHMFQLQSQIYHGPRTSIWTAMYIPSNSIVALKFCDCESFANRQSFEREVRLHMCLDHANIVIAYSAFIIKKKPRLV